MDQTTTQWTIEEGTDVVGADGGKVGKVVAANSSYLVVEKGFFFPTDYYIPMQAVAGYDGERVVLNVSKDDALHQGWDVAPSDDTVGTGTGAYLTGATAYDESVGSVDAAGNQLTDSDFRVGGVTAETGSTRDTGMGDVNTADVQAGETIRVPIHEEELTATKRPVELGDVRITKEVVTENRTLEVPVTEERLRVERRVVDREGSPDAMAFKDETIEIPLRSEDVEVQKRVRVAEEVEVGKDRVQHTEQVGDTVRRENVRVKDNSGAEVTDVASGTTAAEAIPDRQ